MRTTTALQRHHGIHWAPETRLGVWTVSLAGFAIAGLAALILAAAFGSPADDWSDWVRIPIVTVVLGSGAASAVTGIVATVREHERSWLVFGALAFGVLTVLQQVAAAVGWLGD